MKKKESRNRESQRYMNTNTLFTNTRCELIDSKIVAIYDAVANEAIRCARCNGDAKLRATPSVTSSRHNRHINASP